MQANYKWVRHKYNFDNLGQVRQRFMINTQTHALLSYCSV